MLIVKIMDFVGKSLLAALIMVVGLALIIGLVLLIVQNWSTYSLQICVLTLAVAVIVAGERIASAMRTRA